MKAKQFLRELYTRTVQAKNVPPKDAELDEWSEVLKDFNYSDVDAALRRWANDTTIEDFTQRPRGARVPKAIELKVSIMEFNNAANRPKTKFDGCEQCERTGWIKVGPRVRRCDCFYNWARVLGAK
jgi:hypothetical protein